MTVLVGLLDVVALLAVVAFRTQPANSSATSGVTQGKYPTMLAAMPKELTSDFHSAAAVRVS
jgi:hypothetical protein